MRVTALTSAITTGWDRALHQMEVLKLANYASFSQRVLTSGLTLARVRVYRPLWYQSSRAYRSWMLHSCTMVPQHPCTRIQRGIVFVATYLSILGWAKSRHCAQTELADAITTVV